MMQAVHTSGIPTRLVAERGVSVPVDRLVLGKPVEEAATLLPRVFNLCRHAQGLAARMAMGLETDDDTDAVQSEILRDHLFKFFLSWPRHLQISVSDFPKGWENRGVALRRAVFGRPERAPDSMTDLDGFLASGQGVAPVLSAIRAVFDGRAAVTLKMPIVMRANAIALGPLENSVAGRQSAHPVMQAVEARFGRGPFWRALARLYDLDTCIGGRLPQASRDGYGVVTVPATRGLYAIKVDVVNGHVTALTRVTPTDHLLAKGGVMDQSLGALPADKRGLSGLLLDILDPCVPVNLREVGHA